MAVIRRRSPRLGPVLGALAAGLGLMYFLDPRSGGRRRALVRDKAVRSEHVARQALVHAMRDAENRGHGLRARAEGLFRGGVVDDDVLVQRVRAKLGHVCAHPHAIQVLSKGNGCIELKGDILVTEHFGTLAALSLVRGVRLIDDDLQIHESADIPSLQGESRQVPSLARAWNPTTRLALAGAGLLIGLRGFLRGGLLGVGSAAIGAAMIAPVFERFPSQNGARARGKSDLSQSSQLPLQAS